MDVLKKIALLLLLSCSMLSTSAQSNEVLQRAFHNSYVNEANKNYAAAINDIMPYYSDDSYEVNIRLGWLHYLNRSYTTSQSYYAKAVALKPSSIEAKFGYVKPLSFLQSWDKVLQQYLDIIRIDPQNTQANYWAGVIYYNHKQYATAIKCFRIVATLYPYDYDGNQMLAWAYLMDGQKTTARIYFEKALIIKPGDQSCTDGLKRAGR